MGTLHEDLCTFMILLLLQSALQPLGGFRPVQLLLSILSRKVLQSAVASGTSNHQLGDFYDTTSLNSFFE
jgi:hypothetical protein